MDLKLTGAFIKEQRKAKNLTQAELAQKLMVSEKTVSKWECGNGFPDTTLMLPLCEALNISANELLSAKRLDEKEYKKEAESNLVLLQTQKEMSDKLALATEWVLGIISTIILLGAIIVAGFVSMPIWAKIVVGVAGSVLGFVGLWFCMIIETRAGFYECSKCHYKHVPTFSQSIFSMHFGRTKYMKCPNCKKHPWQKKVVK